MAPKDIACRACAQQPGEDCAEWKPLVGMVAVPGLIHPERVIDAASMGDGSPAQFTEHQIGEAILKTGLI